MARRCTKCGREEKQINAGYNRSGTQRYVCKECNHKYTPKPRTREYSDEIKSQAIKIHYSRVSARGVGKILGMSKSNVLCRHHLKWIKKTPKKVWKTEALAAVFEIDELYWLICRKSRTKTRENIYLILLISRDP